jgi:hypothetical protein
VDVAARKARLADVTIGEGEWISVDGDNGCSIWAGEMSPSSGRC